jgi:hypothetical protein
VPARPAAGRDLVQALYRGLGVPLEQLTAGILARELAIAQQLVLVGATPAEAEAYARDMASLPGRLAPVDLRSFERERPSDVEHLRQRSEALILGADTDTLSGQVVLAPADWTGHLLEYLDRSHDGGLAGASTGLADLDRMTLGLSPGLYLLAASTGTGKSALAGQVALHVAERHGPVVFVSMELSDVDLGVRLVAVLTTIPKEQLVVGQLSEEQGARVHTAVERLYRSKLYLVAGSGYTTGDIRAHLLRAQAAEGARPALLVVDYVQLLAEQEGDGRSRERNVSAAAKALKNLAGELGVPVLALVQLNRNRAQRADKRPALPDLRESGDLENTADSVLGLYRDGMDNPHSNQRGLAELLVLKNGSWATTWARCAASCGSGRATEISPAHDESAVLVSAPASRSTGPRPGTEPATWSADQATTRLATRRRFQQTG